MGNPIHPSPKVWDDAHRAYVKEHTLEAIAQCVAIEEMLTLYVNTGKRVYWRDALSLINNLEEKANRGSLNRIRSVAYFMCDDCDSDICEHADKYN